MQADIITINVDYLNDGNTTPEAYDRFDEYQNRSVYTGAMHTPAARDTLTLYRTFPTKNGNFNGVQKSATKLSIDCVVPGADGNDIVAPCIVETSYSFPVGVSAADQLKIRQRNVAVQDLDSVMIDLNNKQMI